MASAALFVKLLTLIIYSEGCGVYYMKDGAPGFAVKGSDTTMYIKGLKPVNKKVFKTLLFIGLTDRCRPTNLFPTIFVINKQYQLHLLPPY
jgi:hypothetical protein